jgi:predicted ATPase
MIEVRGLPGIDRPVALTGAGGVGKTWRCRSPPPSSTSTAAGFGMSDLAPNTDPDMIPWGKQ